MEYSILTRKTKLEFKGKLVEKKIQKIKVYSNEGKRKHQRVIAFRNTYYYPKNKKGIPDLNWINRSWDDNDYKNLSLFSDFIAKNRINNLQNLCQKLLI